MIKLMHAVLLFGIFLSSMLFGSDIKLIEASEAIRLIGNKDIVFVAADSTDTYKNNHISGSVVMHADYLRYPDSMEDMHCAPLYLCPKEAQEYIRSKGIKKNQMIIVYDTLFGSDAASVYHFFESLGHKNIRVLNGGLEGIRAIDPNQKVFDKLKVEREEILQQILEAKKSEKTDEVKRLNSEAENINAKMNMLETKLLIQGGEEEKRERSDYLLDEIIMQKTKREEQ